MCTIKSLPFSTILPLLPTRTAIPAARENASSIPKRLVNRPSTTGQIGLAAEVAVAVAVAVVAGAVVEVAVAVAAPMSQMMLKCDLFIYLCVCILPQRLPQSSQLPVDIGPPPNRQPILYLLTGNMALGCRQRFANNEPVFGERPQQALEKGVGDLVTNNQIRCLPDTALCRSNTGQKSGFGPKICSSHWYRHNRPASAIVV